jgi:hypothetical protein
VTSHHLEPEQWDQVRFEYETSPERPTLRGLADKHRVSRSTIFKRAAREHWKQNAALVDTARKQIVQKMEASLEAKAAEAAELAAKEVMEGLRPWIEQQKAEHTRRAVNMAKRGFQRIEKLWDENAVPEARAESLAAATLDKHDAIIRRNLGMNEASAGSCSLNVAVLLPGGRTIISPQKLIDGIGPVAPEKTISQEPAS